MEERSESSKIKSFFWLQEQKFNRHMKLTL